MLSMVESEVLAYERSRKIPDNKASVAIALAWCKKALTASKSTFGDDSGLSGQA